MKNAAQITKLAIAALEDVKGANIEVIDVSPLTSVTDHMIICTGTSNRHVKALADSVMEKALEAGIRPLSSQGLEQGEWALVDLNGTIVHVMQASARATYQLEKLWDLGQPKPNLADPKAAVKAAKKAARGKAAPKKAASAAPKAAKPGKPAARTAAKPVKKAASRPAGKTLAARKPAGKAAPAKPAAARATVAGKSSRPAAAKAAPGRAAKPAASRVAPKSASRSARAAKPSKPVVRKTR